MVFTSGVTNRELDCINIDLEVLTYGSPYALGLPVRVSLLMKQIMLVLLVL